MEEFTIKTRIFSGNDSLKRLSEFKDKKICIVCDSFLVTGGGLKRVLELLDNSNKVYVFNQVIPDLPIEVIHKGVMAIAKFQPNILVAFGGGSAIDTAKGILLTAVKMNVITKELKLIAIPTTSGTGSEVTAVTVVSDPSQGLKQIFHDQLILPDEAILDSSLTVSVNPEITAHTGMDVLTHALEAYVAKNANVYTDALAEKAVALLSKSLLTCYFNGNDQEARLAMHHASNLAGISFNKAGLGLCHAMAHSLGGKFHIPHGLANALLIKEVIKYNCKDEKTAKRYADLARSAGLVNPGSDVSFSVSVLLEYIQSMQKIMNMPITLNECNISLEEFNDSKSYLAENSLRDMCINSNPIPIDKTLIEKLLVNIY